MKQIILISIRILCYFKTTFAQHQVTKRTTISCDLPECQKEYESSTDTSSILGFAATRSLNKIQEKGSSKISEDKQNVYFIENLDAILFIPQSFVPSEGNFYISGATQNIIKIQIYTLSKELVFQTSIADNAWNGIWKETPQYGIFNYKITVKVKDNESEVIEGLVVTRKPI
jgi:hypothetical protein